jgi:hypothetical protein
MTAHSMRATIRSIPSGPKSPTFVPALVSMGASCQGRAAGRSDQCGDVAKAAVEDFAHARSADAPGNPLQPAVRVHDRGIPLSSAERLAATRAFRSGPLAPNGRPRATVTPAHAPRAAATTTCCPVRRMSNRRLSRRVRMSYGTRRRLEPASLPVTRAPPANSLPGGWCRQSVSIDPRTPNRGIPATSDVPVLEGT